MKKALIIVAVLVLSMLPIQGARASLDQGGAISGYVHQEDGNSPIAGAWVYAMDTSFDFVEGTHSLADGSYQITGLTSGDYYIAVSASGYGGVYYDDAYDDPSATQVTVNAPHETSGIDFQLSPEATVSGHVYEADGSTPIQGVEVRIWPREGGQIRSAISDSTGSYTVGGLSTGDYIAQVDEDGYAVEYYQEATSWSDATAISVVQPSDTGGIDFTLTPGGAISGHVYEQDGVTPVANACVNVSATAPDWNQIAGFCCTDADGGFTISGLPEGDVYVKTHADCQGAHPNLQDEWYAEGGSTPHGDQATSFTVVAGQTTPGADFTLDSVGSISGAIYNADGSSLVSNVMYGFESTTQQGNYTTWCTGDGQFSAPLEFGSYKVFAQGDSVHCGGDPNYAREYWHEKDNWAEADVITLSPESPSVTGIIFTLSQGGSLSGHVYQSDGVTPIDGADVWAAGPDDHYTHHTHSQADGSYTIGGLPDDTYKVKAVADGYTWEWYQEKDSHWDADTIVVTAPEEVSGIDFTLDPAGAISGHVFKADGSTVITDALISVHAHGVSAGSSSLGTHVSQVDGSYTISGLAPGIYKVQANNNLEPGYVTKYYDDRPTREDADTIEVLAGETTSGIEFTLEESGVITGHVYEEDGVTPVANACVNVSSTAPEWNQVLGWCCTGADGSFRIGSLPTGDYYLRTHANCQGEHTDLHDEWYAAGGSTPDGNQATPVAVIAGQTTPGIDFALDRVGTISGVVYDASGSNPISWASVGTTPSNTKWSYWTHCADESGRFSIPRAYGSYKVFARGDRTHCGSDPNYAREFWPETAYWDEANTVTLTVDAPSATVTFTLEMGGSIGGNVYDEAGSLPVGGGVVIAESVDEELSSFVCAEGDGSYVIPGLPLGDYKVYAQGYCRADPNYLVEYWQEKATWDQADTVSLSAGSREMKGTDFTLELGGAISGQVLKADGVTPVEGACVNVSSTAPQWNQIGGSRTDTEGRFTVRAVPAGDVYVRTQADCQGAYPDLQDEWYATGGSTPDASLADTVVVQSGQVTSGVNFALDVASSTTVLPGAGGAVSSTAETTTTLSFPPNAVSEPVTVTFRITTSQPASGGFSFLGQSFSIEASAADGTPVTVFSETFTITIHYDDADVKGLEEASLRLHYWDSSTEQWDEVPTSLDTDANKLTATLDHLSDFAVLGKYKYGVYLPSVLRGQ